ncbi:RagB/SusD family nutrient uptake outer membrane protein [Pseudobacter ginsenosidimutans]|uniref:SusD-like starch-binding protein associating with outer membrane n=1 Tax=Pseudobacter ginsenosidimutans TaxID=661488 RepID=A0A4Q7MPY7_9BACT|nr:RagB/SusD family nutrient uptake outer membrane protein [Pseudobacter ginsenosidimutans]QEC42404.1 RagB/SusD family nutrient uptake outer membrane protein [Pseudobacter ginsenosidimutans]RZS70745.1 SusD-like starch-binding protein associating with outer membrane [Pseudobacter ginsenosidimutans]
MRIKNKISISLATLFAAGLLLKGCTKTELVTDPNYPAVETVLNNATKEQINQLGVGVQSVMRNGLSANYTWSGCIGREVVYYASTESRFHEELQGSKPIDPGGLMMGWYSAASQTRRRAEILHQSAEKSSALSDAEKLAVKGFVKTVQAYVMLNAANMAYSKGIRTSFTDLRVPGDMLKPGCFSTYEQSLAYIKQLVEDGNAALKTGSNTFPFPMTAGWAGFETPEKFGKFNRAVAARVAMYQKDWAALSSALNESFINETGSMDAGPKFTYSTTANDATNPFFQNENATNVTTLVQVNFVPEAEAGDKRVFGLPRNKKDGTAKVKQRTNPLAPTGFPLMPYEVQMFETISSPVGIIRNEELLLMKAEAAMQSNDLDEAVRILNIVRDAAGLNDYAGAVTSDAVLDELLNQRRYGLFMEGHRWFDMRRYDRLSTLPKDNAEHQVWTEFPRLLSEVDWDSKYPCN